MNMRVPSRGKVRKDREIEEKKERREEKKTCKYMKDRRRIIERGNSKD